MLTRKELIDKIEQLSKDALAANEKAAAAVLLGLCGALAARSEVALKNKCVEHAEADIKRMSAFNN